MRGKTRSFDDGPSPGNSPGPGAAPPLPDEPVIDREGVIEQITSRIEQLPSLPGIVQEFVRLAQHPSSSASDFEKVIRQDQVLAGRLMQVANSSLYAREKSVATITEAVILLGLDQIKSLAYASSGSKLLAQKLEWYGYEGTGLWLHSIACAHAARFMASRAGLKKRAAEQMYVAGLIHDVGKVMLGGALREVAPDFAAPLVVQDVSITTVEESHLSISHAEVGEMIGAHWQLSTEELAAIRHHHDPASAGGAVWAAAVVHAADGVSTRVGLGIAGAYRFSTKLDTKAVAILGLKPEAIVECAKMLRDQAGELERTYSGFIE